MRYYSVMECTVKIKTEKIEEFKKKVKELKSSKIEIPDFVSYFLEGMTIDDEGGLEWGEYYSKWYGDVDFAAFLRQYVFIGDLEFTGEDGNRWGYSFKDGEVYEIFYNREVGNNPLKFGKELFP